MTCPFWGVRVPRPCVASASLLPEKELANLCINHALSFSEVRSQVFRGDLIVQSRRPATQALADHAQLMILEALGDNPERAQFRLTVEEFIQKVGPLKTRFTNDRRTKELVRDVLSSFGCDLADTSFDVPRLRVVPHGDYLSSGVSYAYKAHRDTWYSSPFAQVNWWMPAFDVTPERAMSMLPGYWDQPVANSSGDFDYGEWCSVGRKLAAVQGKVDTRKHPLPSEAVRMDSELRIAGTTGDMLIFSAAQLHATAPNESGVTRFSIDFRTVSHSDLQERRGAPNVDTKARGTTLGDFLSATDFSHRYEDAMKMKGWDTTGATQ